MTTSYSSVDIESRFADVSRGLNESLDLSPLYDQTKGNRCDLLTHAMMMQMIRLDGVTPRRELHQNNQGDWHYILAHEPIEAKPTNDDLVSDLNPWQWGGQGSGILHMPRGELLDFLSSRGAPAQFVALRSIETITCQHDVRANPFRR